MIILNNAQVNFMDFILPHQTWGNGPMGLWHFQPRSVPTAKRLGDPGMGFLAHASGRWKPVTEKRIEMIPMAQDWCLRQRKYVLFSADLEPNVDFICAEIDLCLPFDKVQIAMFCILRS
jgi:hypothetical protein